MKRKALRFGAGFRVTLGNRRSQSATMVIAPGTLLLIEKGDRHEIRNTGRAALRTLNFYVPPAYDPSGDELPRGRR